MYLVAVPLDLSTKYIRGDAALAVLLPQKALAVTAPATTKACKLIAPVGGTSHARLKAKSSDSEMSLLDNNSSILSPLHAVLSSLGSNASGSVGVAATTAYSTFSFCIVLLPLSSHYTHTVRIPPTSASCYFTITILSRTMPLASIAHFLPI